MGIIIKGASVVLQNSTKQLDILLENGKISALGEALPTGDHQPYNATNCIAFAGFIDGHTHLDMHTGTALTADNFASGTLAALCGGTTSIIDFATQEKGGTLIDALNIWHKKAEGRCSCNYGFHMAITDYSANILSELDTMLALGVSSFKVYMAYDALRLSDSDIYEILHKAAKLGGIVGCHCENGDLVNKLVAHQLASGNTGTLAHPLSRPPYLEAEAITRFCAIGKAANAPVHIVHVSSALGLDAVKLARNNGTKVYAEGCMQYMSLYDDVYALNNFEGAKYVCSPPLRKKADGEALWQAIQQGEINTIATDHCSFNFATQKILGIDNFAKIPNGMPSIEHRPILFLDKAIKENMPLHKTSALLSTNAAKLFGMTQKGQIEIGFDADITIYDPHNGTTITAQNMHQNVDYTPFEGTHTCGRIKAVFLNGELCAEQGEPILTCQGQYIKRNKSSL